jgi:hypothetical protein
MKSHLDLRLGFVGGRPKDDFEDDYVLNCVLNCVFDCVFNFYSAGCTKIR